MAEQILEADAEFYLRDNYPETAGARARYYAEMQRRAMRDRPWETISATNRPYAIVGHLLCVELAMLLLRDCAEETGDLHKHLAQLRGELEALNLAPPVRTTLGDVHALLSPSRNDFRTVGAWGPAAYRTVVALMTEAMSA